MESGLKIGDEAPDFTLKDSTGDDIRLYDFKGKVNVVLGFFRSGSEENSVRWLTMLRDDYLVIKGLDSEVLAISSDSIEENLDTGGRYDIPFKLLSDTGCEVIRAYGIYDTAENKAVTSVYIIDKTGKIAYKYIGMVPRDVPDNTELIITLRSMM